MEKKIEIIEGRGFVRMLDKKKWVYRGKRGPIFFSLDDLKNEDVGELSAKALNLIKESNKD